MYPYSAFATDGTNTHRSSKLHIVTMYVSMVLFLSSVTGSRFTVHGSSARSLHQLVDHQLPPRSLHYRDLGDGMVLTQSTLSYFKLQLGKYFLRYKHQRTR